MSDANDDSCDCRFFDEGDWVVSRLNASVFGIIVGESDFGRYYQVQLVDTLEVKAFYGCTLQHMGMTVTGDDGSKAPLPAANNVIFADFGAHTETKGAA